MGCAKLRHSLVLMDLSLVGGKFSNHSQVVPECQTQCCIRAASRIVMLVSSLSGTSMRLLIGRRC